MIRTADDIIKEAELQVEKNAQLKKDELIQKTASDVSADLISQRNISNIEKTASESPLIKLAMESEGDPFKTKSFKVNYCIEKVALSLPAGSGEAVKGFLQKMMTSDAGKRIAIGAGVGAAGGLLAGNKDDRMGSALKGTVLS